MSTHIQKKTRVVKNLSRTLRASCVVVLCPYCRRLVPFTACAVFLKNINHFSIAFLYVLRIKWLERSLKNILHIMICCHEFLAHGILPRCIRYKKSNIDLLKGLLYEYVSNLRFILWYKSLYYRSNTNGKQTIIHDYCVPY
jgi:hypothetical protein